LQSFGLGWLVGSQPLFWALFISFVLGTAYSINVRAHFSVLTFAISYIRIVFGALQTAMFFSPVLQTLEWLLEEHITIFLVYDVLAYKQV
jgi:hypothetical protein